MTKSHEQADWPCFISTAEVNSLVPIPQRDLQHDVVQGYATNTSVSPEYSGHSKVLPASYMYGPPSCLSVSGYHIHPQPHKIPNSISEPRILHSNVDIGSVGCPKVGVDPGYQRQVGVERCDGYHQLPWSLQPQQLFTVGNSPYSHPLESTTPCQSTVHSCTQTHKYIRISPASSTPTISAAVASNTGTYGRVTSLESPAHGTLLQIPRMADYNYQTVSLSPTVPATATRDQDTPTQPSMSSHPLHYPHVTSSLPAQTPQRYLKRKVSPVALCEQISKKRKESSDDFELYSWKATPVSSQPISHAATPENEMLRALTDAMLPSYKEADEAVDSGSEHRDDIDFLPS